MNKIQIVINVILVAAVAALFVTFYSSKTSASPEAVVAEHSEVMPVAYLNVDSLLANYTFAQDASDKLMSKQEDARVKMNTKLRTFQNEVADFQRKLENNAFLSRDRAEKEQQRLAKKEQELQELEAKLTQDIMIENQKLNQQLADSLNNFLQIFNADGRYHMILSNTAKDNVLAVFLMLADFMLRMAKKYSGSIQIAFKPHPVLRNKLNEYWGKERTDEYYKEWDSGENTFFENGEYVDLFLTSDAMIHDSGSFLIEYLYLDKPVMRTDNGQPLQNEFNDFALSCLDHYYQGKTEDEVESEIDEEIEEEIEEEAKDEEAKRVANQKKEADTLRKSILEDDKAFNDLVVDKVSRKKIYDNISKPIYKDPDTGEMLTAIQKYEQENHVDFMKYVGLIYTLTDGFKNLDGLVKGKVNKEVKKGLKNLENTINGSSRNSDGSLKFVTSKRTDDDDSYFGLGGWVPDVK